MELRRRSQGQRSAGLMLIPGNDCHWNGVPDTSSQVPASPGRAGRRSLGQRPGPSLQPAGGVKE